MAKGKKKAKKNQQTGTKKGAKAAKNGDANSSSL